MEKETIVASAEVGGPSHRAGIRNVGLAFLLIALVPCFTANAARAGEMHLLINGKAIHFDKRPNVDYNESNWGTGFQYDWTPRDDGWVPFVSASGFDDSNRNPSYYAGGGMLRRYHFKLGATRLHADVGLIGFLMTREGFKDGDPFAGVLPAFSVGGKKVAVNITYIPRVDPKAVPLVFFQLKMKLGEF